MTTLSRGVATQWFLLLVVYDMENFTSTMRPTNSASTISLIPFTVRSLTKPGILASKHLRQ